MKTRVKQNSKFSAPKPRLQGKPRYYFHADEDFREDWNWGKTGQEEVSKQAIEGKQIVVPAVV